ncbi:sulfatase [Botrimarina sp.]|uniref:sulfatase family protein n=1 Tax=Botrimarina sp. TaxID=2795802 RepID=UPI0032EBA14B
MLTNRPAAACVAAALLVSSLCSHACAAESPGAAGRPNLLFIFSDDHSPAAIGAYGGRLAGLDPTPQIDRLAQSGALFRNSFCTNSICGPSRAVVLTGKHSHLNGFRKNGDRFNGDQWTFPKQLQEAGYATAIVGKWHLGSDPQGFDFWRVLPGQGAYYNPKFRTPEGTIEVQGHCTDIVTDMALSWLRDWSANRGVDGGDKPFLMMCQHKAPHRNWMPAPEDLGLYEDDHIPEPPNLFDDLADNASPARAAEMSIRTHMHPNYDLFLDTQPTSEEAGYAADRSGHHNLARMTPEQRAAWDAGLAAGNERFNAEAPQGDQRVRQKYQRYMKNYLRTIRGVDRSVGKLLDFLEESGLAENTVVVYSSDQGFYLGEHGWYDKRWMYEPSLAMPLVVRWPGVTRPGRVVDQMVQNLDYAPTLLDAAGAEVPSEVQGRSLRALLAGGPAPEDWRDAIFYHYYGHPDVHNVAKHRGVRTERYKLIHFYESGEWELYDLRADPDEMQNLYGDPAYADLAARLKKQLERLASEARDDTDVSPVAAPAPSQTG